ncbi:sigma-70 family RNA polymerase sigma factor [Nocardioides marinquilinus]|uniref:sigma-70 family RNA polymerase sigma factor n=1 Tax=Nocardioides marinquilinus TaxID=1210400 RepID=UPI0031ED3AE1
MGDAEAAARGFEGFVLARGRARQRFAFLLTGDRDYAPDLVQEALSRAYPRWRSLQARGTAEAYVRRSIVNASVTRWRKEHRLVSVSDTESHVRDHVPDATVARDDADVAWRLLSSLPAQQRAAVVLRYYDDLTFSEVAAVPGCPESTARSHVRRAMGTLRTQLVEDADD